MRPRRRVNSPRIPKVLLESLAERGIIIEPDGSKCSIKRDTSARDTISAIGLLHGFLDCDPFHRAFRDAMSAICAVAEHKFGSEMQDALSWMIKEMSQMTYSDDAVALFKRRFGRDPREQVIPPPLSGMNNWHQIKREYGN